jgi:hypothetical protein
VVRARILVAVFALFVGSLAWADGSRASPAADQSALAYCAAIGVPLGALPPAVAAWCDRPGMSADTAQHSGNSWSDGFAGGAVHGKMPASYRVFDSPRSKALRSTTVNRTEHFLNNGHWMVDIGGGGAPSGIYEGSAKDFFTGPNNGGGLMRPDASFTFEDGHLIVDFEAAAGMTAYGDRVWPEIVVTTAPAPSDRETNGWYAAGLFGGYPAIGCAFPADRLSECRVYDADKITAWLSAQSAGGAKAVFGGAPTAEPQRSAWHLCGDADSDSLCRDRFRVDLSRDTVKISVNGVLYMEHRGLPASAQLPEAMLTSPVYVYFASWAYLVEPTVARVHWGRIAINPPPLLMR